MTSPPFRCSPLSACFFFPQTISPANKEPQTWDWSYQFLKLSAAERHERRVVLDRYGLYAQLSALLVIVLFVVGRLAQRVLGKKRHAVYDTESTSLANLKHQRWLSVKLRIYQWWLGGDVEFSGLKLGRRDEVMLGSIWTAWLLFLCIAHTGNGAYIYVNKFWVPLPLTERNTRLLSPDQTVRRCWNFSISHSVSASY